MAKKFQQIVDSINILVKLGVLDSEDERFLKKSLKDFEHSLSIKNIRKAHVLVDQICKRFLEKMR